MALLDCLIVPEGLAGLSQRDPSVLYMLARQRFGGLTAITKEALDAFCVAQALISAHLSLPMIAHYGQHAFNTGVEAVLASEGGHGRLALHPASLRPAPMPSPALHPLPPPLPHPLPHP